MPGSPASDVSKPTDLQLRTLHPGAVLLSFALIGIGLSVTRAPWILLAAAAAAFALALRVERRPIRGEIPLLSLAAVVFAAHLLLSGKPFREAVRPAAEIACRLLALLYGMRWAARAFLPRAARWIFGRSGPKSPRVVALLFESARMTLALLPLALREAERQHTALRARAIRPARGAAGRARYLAAWFLPFLGTMLRVGDAYGEALLARGYAIGGARRSGMTVRWGMAEIAMIIGSSAAAVWLIRAQ